MGISALVSRHWAAGLLLLMSFAQPAQNKTKVWLVGDSTMADKEIRAYPETGWGMPFETFFDSSVVVTIAQRMAEARSPLLTKAYGRRFSTACSPAITC